VLPIGPTNPAHSLPFPIGNYDERVDTLFVCSFFSVFLHIDASSLYSLNERLADLATVNSLPLNISLI